MKDQISKIVLETMLGIRKGVGEARKEEFEAYIKDLIEAKESGVDLSLIQSPMMSDNVKQGIEAYLSYGAHGGLEGGGMWGLFTLGGKIGSEKTEQVRISVDLEFKSIDSPNFKALKSLSAEDLKGLI